MRPRGILLRWLGKLEGSEHVHTLTSPHPEPEVIP
jgi:hypothetical protein